MNPETRNLVAAISLSMAVLIGYQLLFVEPKKELYQQENIVKDSVDTSNIPCLLYTSPSPRDDT